MASEAVKQFAKGAGATAGAGTLLKMLGKGGLTKIAPMLGKLAGAGKIIGGGLAGLGGAAAIGTIGLGGYQGLKYNADTDELQRIEENYNWTFEQYKTAASNNNIQLMQRMYNDSKQLLMNFGRDFLETDGTLKGDALSRAGRWFGSLGRGIAGMVEDNIVKYIKPELRGRKEFTSLVTDVNNAIKIMDAYENKDMGQGTSKHYKNLKDQLPSYETGLQTMIMHPQTLAQAVDFYVRLNKAAAEAGDEQITQQSYDRAKYLVNDVLAGHDKDYTNYADKSTPGRTNMTFRERYIYEYRKLASNQQTVEGSLEHGTKSRNMYNGKPYDMSGPVNPGGQ